MNILVQKHHRDLFFWLKASRIVLLCLIFACAFLVSDAAISTARAQETIPEVVPRPPGFSVSGGVCTPHGCCRCTPRNRRCCPVSCEAPGRGRQAATRIFNAFRATLLAKAPPLEAYEKDEVDNTIAVLLTRLNQVELDLIEWWKTLWWYNLRPSLQDSVDQTATALADQNRMLGAASDAENMNKTLLHVASNDIDDHRALGASENICVAASSAGGFGRAEAFSHAMRQSWQNDLQASANNKKGAPGATGRDGITKHLSSVFETTFCNPDDNAGRNICGAKVSPEFYNADVSVNKYLYNSLTIPVDQDPTYAAAVERIIENLTGTAVGEPISGNTLKTAEGQELWLQRRSYIARKNAVRSVPTAIASERMPGSRLGEQIKELRIAAGVPESQVSANPSYHEIMHAVSVDRFNSGQYAAGLLTDENKIEMEKLTLDTFYLMQLRDYYELLERTALTLAVQVSLMADTAPDPDAKAARPLR